MANPTPYRMLPAERRIALLTHAISTRREFRLLYIQRLAALPGGFRPVTLQSWPAEKLAREVTRRKAEKPDDEVDLLHHLYVEFDPSIQSTFLEVTGVKHEDGKIDEALEVPYTDAESVRRGAGAVRERHGTDGEHYLRTIARYNPEGWPGIEQVIGELTADG
jgi:hypothetical protein